MSRRAGRPSSAAAARQSLPARIAAGSSCMGRELSLRKSCPSRAPARAQLNHTELAPARLRAGTSPLPPPPAPRPTRCTCIGDGHRAAHLAFGSEVGYGGARVGPHRGHDVALLAASLQRRPGHPHTGFVPYCLNCATMNVTPDKCGVLDFARGASLLDFARGFAVAFEDFVSHTSPLRVCRPAPA